MSEVNLDILSSRYASEAMNQIWSLRGRFKTERQLWVAVMKAQKEQGLDIPQEAIDAYENVVDDIDLESIEQREKILRHDVKARIEEFCAKAGHEQIHKGMTSRDLTDNVEQLQVFQSLKLIAQKYVACLLSLSNHCERHATTPLIARTHNVPAQPSSLGKRLAMFAEDMLFALQRLEELIDAYPLRGLKGAVGTQLDQQTLFEGHLESVQVLDEKVRQFLGFTNSLHAVGQIYSRSLDYQSVNRLCSLSAPISSLATTLRLMAGHELVSEGFQKGQVGSSAMPHKMNMRSCERLCGFHQILNGYLTMLSGLNGGQWNEGDVSDSVVRRVALPSAMFAIDGQLETFLTILDEMTFYPSSLNQEWQKHLPFASTTVLLMEALKKGIGREEGHEVIKQHAVATLQAIRHGQGEASDFAKNLGTDPHFPMNQEEIQTLLSDSTRFFASAHRQTLQIVKQIQALQKRYPNASQIRPAQIL